MSAPIATDVAAAASPPPPPLRQRRSAVRFTNLQSANASPILSKANKTVSAETNFGLPATARGSDAAAHAAAPRPFGLVASMQGWRRTMEDAHVLHFFCPVAAAAEGEGGGEGACAEASHDRGSDDAADPTAVLAVFDGHRGAAASTRAAESLLPVLSECFSPSMLKRPPATPPLPLLDSAKETVGGESEAATLASAQDPPHGGSGAVADDAALMRVGDAVCWALDARLRREPAVHDGTTFNACVVLRDGRLVLINVGDSRSYVASCERVGAGSACGSCSSPLSDAPDGECSARATEGAASRTTSPPPSPGMRRMSVLEVASGSSGTYEEASPPRPADGGGVEAPTSTQSTEDANAPPPPPPCPLRSEWRGVVVEATSHDHRATEADEAARVAAAGGFVANGRVNGKLAVSRALGDFDMKQAPASGEEGAAVGQRAQQVVTCTPEVRIHAAASPQVYRLVLVGCDGVWERLRAGQIVDRLVPLADQYIHDCAAATATASAAGEDGASTEGAPSHTAPASNSGSSIHGVFAAQMQRALGELLDAACSPFCDQTGGALGMDNMTLGALFLP